MGSQENGVITTIEMEEGAPTKPPIPSLALNVGDFKGREIDLVVEQAPKNFFDDERFINSG